MISQHWLESAKCVPSPFFDERPDSKDVSLLVIHNISLPPGQFGGPYIEQLFTGRLNPNDHPYFEEIHHLRVSAHLLIRRDGSLIQFVPFNCRAWHAGVSCFDGREKCNDYAIGIELEGSDFTPFTQQQYDALQMVTKALFEHYPKLNKQRITSHQAISPVRKSDPGHCFDWYLYYKSLV
ncbi:1,6-anhydro-N-acetylmuramyl-L-alanine amidase AmpD [Thaumasiovibrio subtropicus]|uniref:1,6-anhydro-N-acetylmuramyl-L-alanine amidase AmpD n=1 Tax=Thaumasiovibrio subtropicus TaxID=1891207 RepID=UPI000B361845|nr:1,6-anhydro-N-acetylmuramyl-L-alanine amidase AmpD [Thaumasiovibrio subtropicus]